MKKRNLEDQEQKSLVEWFKLQYPGSLLFAIPNGGSRHIVEARKLVATGVVAGVPDLFLCEMRQNFGGLFIEMKRKKEVGKAKPVVSAAQKDIIAHLDSCGYCVKICFGFEEARDAITSYLDL